MRDFLQTIKHLVVAIEKRSNMQAAAKLFQDFRMGGSFSEVDENLDMASDNVFTILSLVNSTKMYVMPQ